MLIVIFYTANIGAELEAAELRLSCTELVRSLKTRTGGSRQPKKAIKMNDICAFTTQLPRLEQGRSTSLQV